MVWWLGIHLPMWETHVRSLVEELRSHIPWDPLNPWTPTTEPECPRACVPQQKESFHHSWRKPACSKEQRRCSQKKKRAKLNARSWGIFYTVPKHPHHWGFFLLGVCMSVPDYCALNKFSFLRFPSLLGLIVHCLYSLSQHHLSSLL